MTPAGRVPQGQGTAIRLRLRDTGKGALRKTRGRSCFRLSGAFPEEEGGLGFPFPGSPGAPEEGLPGLLQAGDPAQQTAPYLDCPPAVFLEELEVGSIECHVSDASGRGVSGVHVGACGQYDAGLSGESPIDAGGQSESVGGGSGGSSRTRRWSRSVRWSRRFVTGTV